MSDPISAVSETLFLPLYTLALDARSDHPILVDEEAVALTEKLNETFARSDRRFFKKLARGKLPGTLLTTVPLRIRHFDEVTRAFLERDPDGVVVSLGSGLSNRKRRVDNGRVRWVDLDLPPVIALRREHFVEDDRTRSIAASVLDFEWMDQLPDAPGGRFLFLAEGLFPYLEAAEVQAIVVALRERFPGAELLAEVASRAVARISSGRLGRGKFRRQFGLSENVWMRSGLSRADEMESWAEGIELLEDWDIFDEDEPRLNWMRPFARWDLFGRAVFVVRYRLGWPST